MVDDCLVLPALVVALKANYFEVEIDKKYLNPLIGSKQLQDVNPYMRLLCTRRSRLNFLGQNVAVGDNVAVESIDWKSGRAVINEVFPRNAFLSRPPVANVSTIIVVISVREPVFDINQASRFLLTAEQIDLEVEFVFTKIDLISRNELEEFHNRIMRWGYSPIFTSIKTGQGLNDLLSKLKETQLSVICGPSGVGKTSLLNYMIPDKGLKVGELSAKLKRGRNTTRHVELYRIGEQSLVADTPGFNQPELPNDPSRLQFLFPELRQQISNYPCRFRNCLHKEEPGCQINKDWERYAFYRTCLDELSGVIRSSQADSN